MIGADDTVRRPPPLRPGVQDVVDALGEAFGERTAEAGGLLAMIADYGAGEVLAGWSLERHLPKAWAKLESLFPGLQPKRRTLGGLLDVLAFRPGPPAVDRVLAALDACARAGTGVGFFGREWKRLEGARPPVIR